jgi:hypothetical protein
MTNERKRMESEVCGKGTSEAVTRGVGRESEPTCHSVYIYGEESLSLMILRSAGA